MHKINWCMNVVCSVKCLEWLERLEKLYLKSSPFHLVKGHPLCPNMFEKSYITLYSIHLETLQTASRCGPSPGGINITVLLSYIYIYIYIVNSVILVSVLGVRSQVGILICSVK